MQRIDLGDPPPGISRTFPLDPPAGHPDPIGYYAATIAETAAILIHTRGACHSGHPGRCKADPATPMCIRCALAAAHLGVALHHYNRIDVDVFNSAAVRIYLAMPLSRQAPAATEAAFTLLMATAHRFAAA